MDIKRHIKSHEGEPMTAARFWMRVVVAMVFAMQGVSASAQDEKKDPGYSAEELAQMKAKSLELMKNIVPDPAKHRPVKEMQNNVGRVTWGHLFSRDEVTALASVVTREPFDETDYPGVHVSLLAWQKGRWVYRGFLGDAASFEIMHRKGTPAIIVQGSSQSSPFNVERISWRYDPASRNLIPTGWDDWEPFYIIGDYIGYEGGVKHDWGNTIYRFKDGKPGEWVCKWHETDSGEFDLTFVDPHFWEEAEWAFAPKDRHAAMMGEDVRDYLVTVSTKAVPPKKITAELKVKAEHWGSADFFELLSGLNAEILEGKWKDELPAPKLRRVAVSVTGDPEIVARLQWPPGKKLHAH